MNGFKALAKSVLRRTRRDGIIRTGLQVWPYFRRRANFKKEAQIWQKNILTLPSSEERFTQIYRGNYWRSDETVSGHGSSLKYTAVLRAELPAIIQKFSIRSVFDAPCGDFNWMQDVLPQLNVQYTGGDIVLPLIKELASRYESESVSFVHLDLTRDCFPHADIMICRDCLFHLSYEDTKSLLENFLKSGIPYLFTSTHLNDEEFVNRDIVTGDFRRIDLFANPYNFPRETLIEIDDWIAPHPRRKMCLWTRNQIADSISRFVPRTSLGTRSETRN